MKTKKRFFALLLLPALIAATSVMMVAFNGGTFSHDAVLGEPDVHTHDGMTPWGDESGQETSLPNSAGSYYLTKDITINSTWNVSSNITLCLNGHSITKTGSINTVIRTNGSNAELNIYDCGMNPRYYYIDPTSHLGVVVDTLEEAQAGNPDRNGSFNGGYITGGRGQMYDGDYRGGCAIVDNFSNFNLYGGTLIGNMADTSHKGGSYGTIWARFGDFAMHGGAIIGNYSRNTSVFAANVNNGHGSFTMDGGLIADNTAEAGGTIAIWRLVACSITGGVIRRNYSIAANSSGSALYIASRKSDADTETKVHIGGDVEITENRAEGFGAGLYLAPKDWDSVCGSVALSGSPKIYGNYAKQGGEDYVADNLYMSTTNNPLFTTGDSLFLDGALEEGANIGVTIEGGTGVILQNWANFMSEADPADYFFSDDENVLLTADASGNPMLFDLSKSEAMVVNGDDVAYYDTFSDALSAWGDGMTLKLNKDVEGQIAITEGDKTLDVNNHVLHCNSNPTISVDGAKLHIIDSSAKKTIHYYTPSEDNVATLSATPTGHFFEGGYFTGASGGSGLALANGAEVTLSGGTFFGKEGGGSIGASVPAGTTLTIEGTGGIIGNYQNAEKYPYTSGAAMVLNGTLIMRGGKICDNTASTGVGGIRIGGTAIFTMTGGEVSGNMGHSWLSGGIHVDAATAEVNLGGSAKIYNNRYLTSQKNLGLPWDCKVNIVEPFTEEANIHIFPGLDKEDKDQGQATAENPLVLTSNWSEVMGTTDPYGYFTCDPVYTRNLNTLLANYEVYGQDGQVVLAPVSYSVNFDSNSGTGSMPEGDSTSREYALPENSFTAPDGMKFIGWKWNEDGKIYLPGEKVLLNKDTTFVAQWGKAPSPEWNGLSGIVYAADGVTPIAGAKVKLVQGNEIYDIAFTDAGGAYHFNCPDGFYNLVVEYGDSAKTVLVESSEGAVKNITLSAGKTDSILDVDGDLGVAVGGLDLEAEAIRAAESIPEDKDVCITMNVAQKPAETAQNADEIIEEAPEKNFEFYEIKVEKKVDDLTSELDSTSNVIEIVIPYANVTKRDVSVFSFHDGKVVNYVESNTKEAGTFILDKDNGLVRIYANQFSTFALGYTPYFNIGATISLGSYTGNVTATLKNLATEEVITLEDVALDQVSFTDLKKGDYLLTITWLDGATNSITMPITIG